jgi:hypothetical protein
MTYIKRLFIETLTPRARTLTAHTGFRLLGALAVGLPTTFWFLSSGQKADKHNDHERQRALRSSHPGIINTPHKDIETKADGSDSELPADAPNRPDNREKVRRLEPLKFITPFASVLTTSPDREEASRKASYQEGRPDEVNRRYFCREQVPDLAM